MEDDMTASQHFSKTPRKIRTIFLCFVAFLAFVAGTCPAPAQNTNSAFGVMTYNVNEGTDYLQVLSATTPEQFLIGVGEIVTQVQGTNPPERMQAIAAQILAAHPTLVSLQELDQWYVGTFDLVSQTCQNMSLQYDMMQELMSALSAQGGHYQIAMQAPEISFPPTPGLIVTTGAYVCAAVTDSNVILARTDLNPRAFQWSNPQSAQFAAAVPFPTPSGTVEITRSWVSVDVQFHASTFRFIGTHLESFVDTVREAQGAELRTRPANTPLPVIVAMDSNAQAFPLPQDSTYVAFTASGYNDVWQEIYPSLPGLTCCQDETDNNPVSELYQRIDLILTLGNVEGQNIKIIGADPSSRLADGLWPSDHAGVVAQLMVESD
jgi:hypothetical protein